MPFIKASRWPFQRHAKGCRSDLACWKIIKTIVLDLGIPEPALIDLLPQGGNGQGWIEFASHYCHWHCLVDVINTLIFNNECIQCALPQPLGLHYTYSGMNVDIVTEKSLVLARLV